MNWFSELFSGNSIAQAVMVLSMVTAVGVALGRIRIKGISLGIAGVLFAGIFFSHFHMRINPEIRHFAQEFGLILFIYTIGVQVGPNILPSLRKDGLRLNLLAGTIVLMGMAIAISIAKITGLEIPVAAGLFSGATTNTPSLGAATQALRSLPGTSEELVKLPGVGYAVAYPFGIIGILITMIAIRRAFNISPEHEAEALHSGRAAASSEPTPISVRVENPSLFHRPVKAMASALNTPVVVSRMMHEGMVTVGNGNSLLAPNDVIYLVAPKNAVEAIHRVVGAPSNVDFKDIDRSITTRRALVSDANLVNRRLSSLNLEERFGVAVTRIRRFDLEFVPSAETRLKYGDSLMLVGKSETLADAARSLGDSEAELNHPNMIPIFLGIALGVLLGSIPIPVPGMPAPFTLGLAGGPLLAAMALSIIGRVGPLVWYMPKSANLMLREVGIVLFLACVGLSAGEKFIPTLMDGDGLYWMGYGALITIVPLMLVGFIAKALFNVNYLSVCGMLAGSMTDPPALAFANALAPGDAAATSYATVYPLTMLLRILCAQFIVLAFM
ncbi:MAG: putative transporter [bacterium]|nr:putative transporter [bacterium]